MKDLQNNNHADPSKTMNMIKLKEYKVWKLKQKLEQMQRDVGETDQHHTLVKHKQTEADLDQAKIEFVILTRPGVERDRAAKRKEEGNICSSLCKKTKR